MDRSGARVHGQNGAQVHGVHVLVRSRHELAHDDPVGSLRRVKRVPERVDVPVGAQIRQHSAEADAVVWPLPAACHLRCHEPCKSIQGN